MDCAFATRKPEEPTNGQPVPEPGAYGLLLGFGLGGLFALRRRPRPQR